MVARRGRKRNGAVRAYAPRPPASLVRNTHIHTHKHIHAQFRSEMAQQAMQELVQKMTDKCFAKCAGKSGNRLESKVGLSWVHDKKH